MNYMDVVFHEMVKAGAARSTNTRLGMKMVISSEVERVELDSGQLLVDRWCPLVATTSRLAVHH